MVSYTQSRVSLVTLFHFATYIMTNKICFMFLTCGNPLIYWKSWFPIDTSNYNIVVHNKYPLDAFWQNFAIPKEYIIPTSWGTLSLVKATISMLHYATEYKQSSHYILLSDSCIPLYSFEQIFRTMKQRKLSNIFEKRNIRKYGWSYKSQCQWSIFIHNDASKLVKQDNTAKYSHFKIPDEVYFVNELNDYTKLQLTHVDWENYTSGRSFDSNKSGRHPKIWKHISLNDIQNIRNTDALFLRKCSNDINFEILNTPKIFFGIIEKNVFKKMKDKSKDEVVIHNLDIILKSSIHNISSKSEEQKRINKNNIKVLQIWSILDILISNGAKVSHNVEFDLR